MMEAEESHWWYLTLRRLVVRELWREGLGDEAVIADVGCGTGGTAAAVARCFPRAKIVGLDLAPEAIALAKRRGVGVLARASANALPLAPASLDAALLLDVLNHREVDGPAALAGVARALKPGGLLLVNVPAFASLRGRHDAAVHNDRRFTRGELEALLTAAGFEAGFRTYWNAALAPLIWALRVLSRCLPGEPRSDLSPPSRLVNGALGWLLRAELRLARIAPLPFGVSFFIAARRPK